MRNFFLKTILFVLILGGIVIGGSSFLLPTLVSHEVESRLESALHPETQSMRVESSPGFKLVLGEIDSFRGSLDGVTLGKLKVQRLTFDLRQIQIEPKELFFDQQLRFTSFGQGHIEGVIHQDDLKRYIEQHLSNSSTKGLSIETVEISGRGVVMSGRIDVGGFLSGKVTIQGRLEIEGNTLQFATEKLSIGGASLNRLSSGVVKSIPLYDFGKFPIPVQLDRVETGREEIHVFVHPVAQ